MPLRFDPPAIPSNAPCPVKSGLVGSAVVMPFVFPGVVAAAEHFRSDISYQVYDESAGRINVESWYFRGEMNLGNETTFTFQLLRDAISGASPTGALPGGLLPFLADVEDVRNGVLGALSRQFGDHDVRIELSHSREQDYVSNAISLSDVWELNQKNTDLTFGVNYLDDSVSVAGIPAQPKKSYDLFLGISQLLDKDTVLTVNLTGGYSQGYLNDPYKAIQKTDIVVVPDGLGGFINIPVQNIYPENRPNKKYRGVLLVEGKHFFDAVDAALDASLRLADDSYGIFSQTLQVEWRQSLWDRLEITPYIRYYRQDAADFFHNTLDETSVTAPPARPDGSGVNYSADYRLSSLEALSLGLKARLKVSDAIALTAAYEHYDMNGAGSKSAPAAAYPTANIWTFGLSVEF